MTAVPAPEFADRLRSLDHGPLVRFVADLWSASGWETSVDGATVAARREETQRRLLVLPAGRLARWRPALDVDGEIDRVVVPWSVDGRDRLPPGTPDAPVVDADDLRRRLLYAVDPDEGEHLCASALGIPLRGERWASEAEASGGSAGMIAAVAIGLGIVLVAVLAWGAVPLTDGGDERAREAAGVDEVTSGDGTIDPAVTVQTSVEPAPDVAAGTTVYVGSFDGSLYAVDARTGNRTWAFTSPRGPVFSSPTVVDGTVYVGSGDETLYAVDAATGARQWAYTAGAGTIFSSPTVANVSRGDGSSEGSIVYVGTEAGRVFAIDADTGDRVWSSAAPEDVVFSSPAVAAVNGSEERTVFVGSGDGSVYAFDAATGERRWTFDEPEEGVLSSPTVVDGTLYVGSEEGAVYAVDAATGEQRWAATGLDEAVVSSPVVVNGTVFVGSVGGAVYAFDAATGDRRWAFDEPGDPIFASPTVANGTVYVGESGDTVYALDATTGEPRWTFTAVTGGFSSSPTVENGTVYLGSNNGTVYAIEAETGAVAWQFTGSDRIVQSSPTVVADPIDGDSVGSRVRLGTLGHHEEATGAPAVDEGQRSDDGLRVAALSTPEEVEAGTTAVVEATVVNSGNSAANETVVLRFAREHLDQVNVDLGAGESATVAASFTVPETAGEYWYAVAVGDAGAAGTVPVVEPASFEVASVDAPREVGPGERVTIETTVANRGSESGETTIELRRGDRVVSSEEVSLEGGESDTVEFAVETAAPADVDYGERTYLIATDDDTGEATVTVAPPGPPGGDRAAWVVVGLAALLLVGLLLRRVRKS